MQVIIGAVVDIEVDIPAYAGQCAGIGVLPEFPTSLELHLVDIVVGNPIRIVVEDRCGEILLLKFIIGIDDGLHAVAVLDDVEPCEHVGLEILHALILRLVLDVEDRRQVAFLQMDLVEEWYACERAEECMLQK